MSEYANADLVEIRRDLHRHPEAGWKEFRTTALVAAELDRLGYDLALGSDALDADERLGVPSADTLMAAEERAREAGAPEEYLDRMDGVTGVVATRTFGDGPVVGLRVDMDALARHESRAEDHRPAAEGFASIHPGEMHACGHDAHTAIGVGVARAFSDNGERPDGFDGTLKLFFQPAEEGGRGGFPMSRTDHLADVDQLFAVHVGLDEDTGTVIAGYENPLTNAKLDVTFRGAPAHAGGAPNEGLNALQALAVATTNLYAIPRHAEGTTRINVGMVESANAQNVISEEATMRVEVRGESTELNEYMLERARQVVKGAAIMHDVDVETALYGKTSTFEADDDAAAAVADVAAAVDGVTDVRPRKSFGGSEDASYLIRRVQEAGGSATYVGVGASNVAGHHTAEFDIDEDCLSIATDTLTSVIRSAQSDSSHP